MDQHLEASDIELTSGVKLEDTEYPISEIFTSFQGEGVFAGTAMTFIRLAGCSVGKPYPIEDYQTISEDGESNRPPLFPIYTDKCTLYDGRTFPCDTDYRRKSVMNVKNIIKEIPHDVYHVCITGGEPLIHNLLPLAYMINLSSRKIHLETSGSKLGVPYDFIWVTVSPKKGVREDMLHRADEIKLLVDETFDPLRLVAGIGMTTMACYKPVFLQPVNGENEINSENLKRCIDWQNQYHQFRVSPQMHKVVSHYIGSLIR